MAARISAIAAKKKPKSAKEERVPALLPLDHRRHAHHLRQRKLNIHLSDRMTQGRSQHVWVDCCPNQEEKSCSPAAT